MILRIVARVAKIPLLGVYVHIRCAKAAKLSIYLMSMDLCNIINIELCALSKGCL
jgi:hypothetical protein